MFERCAGVRIDVDRFVLFNYNLETASVARTAAVGVLSSVLELLFDYPLSSLPGHRWAYVEVTIRRGRARSALFDLSLCKLPFSGSLENVFVHHRRAILFPVRSGGQRLRAFACESETRHCAHEEDK